MNTTQKQKENTNITIEKKTKANFDVKKLTTLAVLAALAYVAMFATRMIPQVSGFLSFDAKDAVILTSSLIFGPASGLIMTVVISLLELVTVSHTGWIGLIMNIISTGAFVLPASLIYKKMRSIKGMIIGLVSGVLCATVMMILWNYLITPLYMGVPREIVVDMLVPVFMPFNLIKYTINSGLVLLIYKRLISILQKMHILKVGEKAVSKKSSAIGVTIAAVVVLSISITLFVIVLF